MQYAKKFKLSLLAGLQNGAKTSWGKNELIVWIENMYSNFLENVIEKQEREMGDLRES